MTYYLIPRNSFLITKNIDCIADESQPNPIISNSLSGRGERCSRGL